MEQNQCSCPELPADCGDELFGPGDDALLVFRRAAVQGALRDALAGRAAELRFSADTVLSQLVGQCFTQCASRHLPLLSWFLVPSERVDVLSFLSHKNRKSHLEASIFD